MFQYLLRSSLTYLKYIFRLKSFVLKAVKKHMFAWVWVASLDWILNTTPTHLMFFATVLGSSTGSSMLKPTGKYAFWRLFKQNSLTAQLFNVFRNEYRTSYGWSQIKYHRNQKWYGQKESFL